MCEEAFVCEDCEEPFCTEAEIFRHNKEDHRNITFKENNVLIAFNEDKNKANHEDEEDKQKN